MLGSMNPLVQRARNGRWWVTMISFIFSCVAAGGVVGALLGAFGQQIQAATGYPTTGDAVLLLTLAAAVGAIVDSGFLRVPLPTPSRQVDEIWRYRYRNWIYAAGYGVQIGSGIATIVTTAAVYATLLAAFLTASATAGLLLGGLFGLFRSISVVSVAHVKTSYEVEVMSERIARWDRPSKMAAVAGQTVVAVVLVAVLA